ncbi:hypothetical protein A3F60_03455 [Candidatus Roizmanbacteria bacterium RIFCSPHIGHO2_12_FULL_39_8]|uniref:tRNA dimethylallyltransferase n=1 Tax=Candidatus Roizmanbacteria bacterium RIFCSPHIGHO2_12_FULL_39_8 TaxID=1802050 RepID=A0A1F7HU53_9BACT|nr:MAG: hypothetical protein A3F60_03455 [Candidatus Roizmanbacteria bacterium RIFCSPHIGHO2_12_FULL_39_8]
MRDPRTVNLMNKKSKIIIITGQTATGKTALALEYARKYDGEIINCDSRQIYKYLDIITGKDIEGSSKLKTQISKPHLKSQNFQKVKMLDNKYSIGFYKLRTINYKLLTKLWLYDIVKPDQYFSSFDYQQCALWVIKKILSEGKTPIIVGGTYLYLKHLLYGVETENIPPDWKLRKKLENKPAQELFAIYSKLLSQSSNQTDYVATQLNNSEKNNPQRLIRKIEIAKSNKHHHLDADRSKMVSHIILAQKLNLPKLKIELFGSKYKKKVELRKAIESRVEKRLEEGALGEVKKLLKMGCSENDPGLKTIGYQQLQAHLRGVLTKEEAINQWISKEIQYAKRQYTFMKKDKNIQWRLV